MAILRGSVGRQQARPPSHRHRRGASLMEGGGSSFLDWREGGKRKRKRRCIQVGKAPRGALDAWRKATGVANGSIPDNGNVTKDEAADTAGISIDVGIEQYVEAV